MTATAEIEARCAACTHTTAPPLTTSHRINLLSHPPESRKQEPLACAAKATDATLSTCPQRRRSWTPLDASYTKTSLPRATPRICLYTAGANDHLNECSTDIYTETYTHSHTPVVTGRHCSDAPLCRRICATLVVRGSLPHMYSQPPPTVQIMPPPSPPPLPAPPPPPSRARQQVPQERMDSLQRLLLLLTHIALFVGTL